MYCGIWNRERRQGKINCGGYRRSYEKIKAGELVNFVAMQVGGKGGGRADIAQAGGTQPENLEKALNSVLDWVEQKL